MKRRFWRVFRLLILFSVVIAAIAVAIVAQGGEWRVHMLIATGLGIGFTVLVGTALMTLTFFSASSGHDDAAGETRSKSQKDE